DKPEIVQMNGGSCGRTSHRTDERRFVETNRESYRRAADRRDEREIAQTNDRSYGRTGNRTVERRVVCTIRKSYARTGIPTNGAEFVQTNGNSGKRTANRATFLEKAVENHFLQITGHVWNAVINAL